VECVGGWVGKRGCWLRASCVRGAPHPNIALKFQQPQASTQLGLGRRLSDMAQRLVRFLINVHPMSRSYHVLLYIVHGLVENYVELLKTVETAVLVWSG